MRTIFGKVSELCGSMILAACCYGCGVEGSGTAVFPDSESSIGEGGSGMEAPQTSVAQSVGHRDRPNIVLVVSDDQRWDLMSARGHEYVRTPHLDDLAENGTLMENAFVPVAVCSPSRAALLTGREVHKASTPKVVWRNNSFLYTQKTLGKYLQDVGYETAYIGKWHLGDGSKPKPGFDHWESFDWLGDFFDPEIFVNGVPRKFEGFVDDILAKRAAGVVARNERSDKPLFLVVGLKEPHLHFEHPPRHANEYADLSILPPASYDEDFAESGKVQAVKDWLGMDNFPCGLNCFDDSWDKYIKSHYRAILGLDDAIGAIRESIDTGVHAQNTLFIYTSDNGYSLGDHGLTEKHLVYEEPIRVPLLVDAPGNAGSGQSRQELISTLDIAPTILDYADVPVPEIMTGMSLKPLLEGANAGQAPRQVTGEDEDSKGSWRDELFLSFRKMQIAVRTGQFKLIKSLIVDGHYELYDLAVDPKEMQTVYSEAGYAHVKSEMRRRLKNIVEINQWTQRRLFPIESLLISQPISNEQADLAAAALSLRNPKTLALGDAVTTSEGGVELRWQQINVGTDRFADRFAVMSNSQSGGEQSVLAVLPLHLLTDWDPFVEMRIPARVDASAYHAGGILWTNTVEGLPGNIANPPLSTGDNYVILRFDNSGEMDVKLELEAPEDALRLPIESHRLLGNLPGRFFAVEGWQPHSGVSIEQSEGQIILKSAKQNAQIRTQNIFVNEPVNVKFLYSTETKVAASLFWRREHANYSSEFSRNITFEPGNSRELTIFLDSHSEIDALRIDLQNAGVSVAIQNISVLSLQDEILHEWNFNTHTQ